MSDTSDWSDGPDRPDGPDWSADFGPLDGVWLSTARHGPLPRVAAEAAREAIAWKTDPQSTPADAWGAVPARLKAALGRLIGAPADEIVVGTCASHGLEVIAQGLDWRDGDEVLAVADDFPAAVFPWLPLRDRGVALRFIRPRAVSLSAADVAANITPKTRALSVSWVDPFTGHTIDAAAIAGVCRENGVLFILDGSQGIGARPFDVAAAGADAVVSCGQKWLCGPYGTGFAWYGPELRRQLDYRPAYYAAMQKAGGATSLRDYTLHDDIGTARYDMFGSGHFFQFMPWAAAVEYMLDQGIDAVAAHNQELVARLVEGLGAAGYTLISPAAGAARSTLVVASHRDPSRNDAICARLVAAGIHVGAREGNIRIAPHLFNTEDDIDRTLDILGQA